MSAEEGSPQDPITAQVAANMRRLRLEKGLTQTDLAKLCNDVAGTHMPPIGLGLSRSTVAKWENGHPGNISVLSLSMAALALGVEIGELFAPSEALTESAPPDSPGSAPTYQISESPAVGEPSLADLATRLADLERTVGQYMLRGPGAD